MAKNRIITVQNIPVTVSFENTEDYKRNMNTARILTVTLASFYLIFLIAIVGAGIYLFLLLTKALKKYISSKEVREEKKVIRKSLSEALKENRLRCKMTQEFVSETLGVSRQAVSKWENGTSDPSTSNLLALAKLYGISAEELLNSVNGKDNDSKEETQ